LIYVQCVHLIAFSQNKLGVGRYVFTAKSASNELTEYSRTTNSGHLWSV